MCIRSTLGTGDPVVGGGARYEDYRLRLGAGETVQIDMDAIAPAAPQSGEQIAIESGGFDTYVEVRRAGVERALAANDDRPGSLNSTLLFTAPAAGDYVVRARSLIGGEGGYLLAVRRSAPPPAPIAMSGDSVQGALDAASPVGDSHRAFRYALYSFMGSAGDRVRIGLRTRLDGSRLQLLGPDGAPIETDQGVIDHNPQLLVVLPQPGRYLIRVDATVMATGRPNQFTLSLARTPASPPEEPLPIRPGQTIEGVLSLESNVSLIDDGTGRIDFFYKIYALPVGRGETLTVDLEAVQSYVLDPVLDVGAMTLLGFAAARTNDNSGGGTDARLVLQPAAAGIVHLRVRSRNLVLGPFRLRVTRGTPPPLAVPSPASP